MVGGGNLRSQNRIPNYALYTCTPNIVFALVSLWVQVRTRLLQRNHRVVPRDTIFDIFIVRTFFEYTPSLMIHKFSIYVLSLYSFPLWRGAWISIWVMPIINQTATELYYRSTCSFSFNLLREFILPKSSLFQYNPRQSQYVRYSMTSPWFF